MGLYDNLKCDYPLPNIDEKKIPQDYEYPFQTKSFNCDLENYTITKTGRLIHHTMSYDLLPENERPYWGTSEWDEDDMFKMIGCISSESLGDKEYDYTGLVNFYTTLSNKEDNAWEWIEFMAEFDNGQLKRIARINYKKIFKLPQRPRRK